jgi:uncharacterized damage-inducible protein DinB
MPSIADAVADHMDRTWIMLREAIGNCPDSEWRNGDVPTARPVALALHVIETTAFYLSDTPEAHQWGARFECDWGLADAAALPSKQSLLEYLEEIRQAAGERVRAMSVDDLLDAPNTFPWTGPNVLARLLYNLRHMQHHIGMLNAELRRRGHTPSDWH